MEATTAPTGTATRINVHRHSFTGDARDYKLDPPYQGHEYVLVSMVQVPRGESDIAVDVDMFPTDADGDVTWIPLVELRDEGDHATALARVGYTIEEATTPRRQCWAITCTDRAEWLIGSARSPLSPPIEMCGMHAMRHKESDGYTRSPIEEAE